MRSLLKSAQPLSLVLAVAAACAALAPVSVAQAQVNLPALGDSVSEDFDLNDERRLGEKIMRSIRHDPEFLDDPVLSDYLNSLWLPLLDAARQRGEIDSDKDRNFPWETFQVKDRTINAFALPGGYVGVHLGLIALTASADELASVLAHELTHITQRHIARSMTNSQHQTTAAMAAMVLGLILASRSASIDAANAVVMGSQAAMAQGQLNFSREMEREADRIGLQLMGTAGFSSAGMAQMFEKLDTSSRLNDSNQYPYLRSHPLTIERISEARLRMSSSPATRAPSPGLHAMMQARARALMEGDEPALRRLQTLAGPGSPAQDANRLGALYGGALASLQLRDAAAALQAIDAGMALASARFAAEPLVLRDFRLLKLQAVAAAARPNSALPAIAPLLQTLDNDPSRAALLARADAAMAWYRAGAGDTAAPLRNSMEALQTWVTEHRHDALAWQALAQCAGAQGQRLRSLRADAEAAAAVGDVVGAVDRFRVAQKVAAQESASDYVESSIIQSRLRELEAERRRIMAEMRGERPQWRQSWSSLSAANGAGTAAPGPGQ